MALSQQDVQAIAEYAQIELDGDELVEMTTYLNDAVGMLDPILQYDDVDVTPTFHPIGDLSNVMREDVSSQGLTREQAFDNAPSTSGDCFRVPSILGDGGAA